MVDEKNETRKEEQERLNEFVLLDHINIESSDYGKRQHPTAISPGKCAPSERLTMEIFILPFASHNQYAKTDLAFFRAQHEYMA